MFLFLNMNKTYIYPLLHVCVFTSWYRMKNFSVKFCSLFKQSEKSSEDYMQTTDRMILFRNIILYHLGSLILAGLYIISHKSTFMLFPLMTTNNGQSLLAQPHWYVMTERLSSALVLRISHSLNSKQEFSGSFNPDAGRYSWIPTVPEFTVWTAWTCKELPGKMLLENFGTKPNWLVTSFPVCLICALVALSSSKALWCGTSVVLKRHDLAWLKIEE